MPAFVFLKYIEIIIKMMITTYRLKKARLKKRSPIIGISAKNPTEGILYVFVMVTLAPPITDLG